MELDTGRYEEQVVRPLRGRAARLPDDLLTRYAVEESMSPAELGKRLREVRAFWQNKARASTNVGQVCQAFLRADEALRAEHGDLLLDPAWWRRRHAERHRSRQAVLAPLVEDLRRFYGDLGALTAEQLAAVATTYPDVTGAEVAAARAEAGLALVAVRELPRRSGLDGATYRAVVDGLVSAGARSIPDLLHPGCVDVRLLDGFSAGPGTVDGLDAAAVRARIEAVARGRDSATSGPAKHVLGRLRVAVDQGVDLRTLALVHLLDEPRRHRAAGAMPSGLVRTLRAAGVADDEARSLVVQVLAEVTEVADPLEELRAMLAEGRAVAASRFVGGLADEQAADGRALVERRDADVAALRAEADDALARGRPDLAEQHLTAACGLAVDREDLAAELARLPLAPVGEVSAATDGVGVRVAWTVPPHHPAGTHYRIVRRTDRPPHDADDGTVLAHAGPAHGTDPVPPVGRAVHYAVVAARRADGPWSRPVGVTVEVVPPVADVRIERERDAVVGRWTVHPDAVRVQVSRFGASGGPTTEVTAARGSFRDTVVVPGAAYSYSVVALYTDPSGAGELASASVVARSRPRVESAPVTTLSVAPDPDEPDGRALVRWRTPPGAEVEIRVARVAPPGRVGDRMPVAEVEAWGAVLDGVPRDDGDGTVLRAPQSPGRRHYAAFTRAGDALVRGRDTMFDLVAPLRRLVARRRGEETVLSWVWPDDAGVVEVRWSDGSLRTTRAEYLDEGGVHLPTGVVGTVDVRVLSASGTSASTPVTVEVVAPRRTVRYTLARRGSRWCGTREYVVTVPPGQGAGYLDLVVVAAPGRVMPLCADAGEELARGRIDLAAAEPAEIHAPFPRLTRPFWVRCFPADGGDVVLVDPPVADLKVS